MARHGRPSVGSNSQRFKYTSSRIELDNEPSPAMPNALVVPVVSRVRWIKAGHCCRSVMPSMRYCCDHFIAEASECIVKSFLVEDPS